MSYTSKWNCKIGDEVVVIPELKAKASDSRNNTVAICSNMLQYKSTKTKIASLCVNVGRYNLSNNMWFWDNTLLVPYSPSLESWCYTE